MKGQLRRSALPDGLPYSLSQPKRFTLFDGLKPKRFRLRRLFHSEALHQSRLAFFDRPFSTDARKGSASLCQDLSPARLEGSASFLDPDPGESAFPINRSASVGEERWRKRFLLGPSWQNGRKTGGPKRFHRNGWVFPTRRPLFFASTKPEALHQPRPFPASSNRSASVWEFNRREALQSEKRQKGGALPLRRPGGPKRFATPTVITRPPAVKRKRFPLMNEQPRPGLTKRFSPLAGFK